MGVHRLSKSFTSGEITPLLYGRVDFQRAVNGCKKLRNAVCLTQGPVTRRPGTEYLYDLVDAGLDVNDPKIRSIDFIFNENQAYTLIFFMHTDGTPRMVVGTGSGLVVYSNPPADYCPPSPIYTESYDGTGNYDIDYILTDISEITVIHVDSSGVETTLTPTTDYTLTINDPVPHTLNISKAGLDTTGSSHIDVYRNNEGIAGEIVVLPMVSGWDIENFDYAQSGDEIYIAQSGLNPHIIRRWGNECWELVSKTFTDQPSEWSDANGWPEVVAFHQQRLVFAATTTLRQTVWTSKAGDFDDFGVGSPVSDSDAITFTLDSGTQNKIVWIISTKSLNIGTIGNEWTVDGSNRTALTPTNILAQRQTNLGSEPIKPLVVGVTTLFVERYGRAVNEFVYDFNVDSYTTSDMAVIAEHFTRDYGIVSWAYQQTPHNIIWAVREDGSLIGITYQRQHDVIGWHLHTTMNGEIKSVTTIPGSGKEDEVWLIVKRTIDGNDRYYVEKLASFEYPSDAEDSLYLDSYYLYDSIATDTITGLDHLEGETVGVLADGTVHPDRTVSSGSITLTNEFSKVVVGKNIEAEVRPVVEQINARDGTSVGRVQRITSIDIDFYNTVGAILGRYDAEDGEEEEEILFRQPFHPTGTSIPLFTGIKHIDFFEGFDRDSEYFIKQSNPLPFTIRSIVDIIEVNE